MSNGMKDGQENYYISGIIHIQRNFINGNLDGYQKKYYGDGETV